jgi:hypothetical protein
MSDPFSVAGSAIGVVSLGITACKGLIWYIDNAKDAKEKTLDVSARLDSLADALERLQHIVGSLQPGSGASATTTAIVGCATAIHNIRSKLGNFTTDQNQHPSIRSRLRDIKLRLSYPFKQEEITYLRGLLSDVHQELQTALQCLQLYVCEVRYYDMLIEQTENSSVKTSKASESKWTTLCDSSNLVV